MLKTEKKNEKSKSGRKFDSVHACCFRSKKLYTNIQAHLEGHVKEENEMKHIQTLKEMKTTCDNEKKEIQKEILKKKNKKKKKKKQKKKKKKKKKHALLRNRGDHTLYLNVIHTKEGELLIAKRSVLGFNHKEYGPCPECLEWIRLGENYKKNTVSCPSKSKIPDAVAYVQQYIFEGKLCPEASDHSKKEVFPSMMKGQITETAMSDVLIKSLGEFHFMSNFRNKLKKNTIPTVYVLQQGSCILYERP